MALPRLKIGNVEKFISARKTLVIIFLAILPLAYLLLAVYFYIFLGGSALPELNKKITFNQKLYDKLMEDFRQRELNSSGEANKIYIDPFGR